MHELGRIYCLSGCTAVGKTDLALEWALANDAEIVNCDSLLFYRGMDIGTAKPTAAERRRVPHHLIDIMEPSDRMDVGCFVELAVDAISQIQARGKSVLATGGSGFYLKAFFEPVVDSVQVSEETRTWVAGLMEEGLALAVAELRRRNPNGLGRLDADNPRRVVKALERCIESGTTLEELEAAFARERSPLADAEKALTILERDRDELSARIALRVSRMLDEGLLDEVERLRATGFESNPSAAGAIGYREALVHLNGEMDRGEMVERICINTRRLAKKQRTWFRGQLPGYARFVDVGGGRAVGIEALFSPR